MNDPQLHRFIDYFTHKLIDMKLSGDLRMRRPEITIENDGTETINNDVWVNVDIFTPNSTDPSSCQYVEVIVDTFETENKSMCDDKGLCVKGNICIDVVDAKNRSYSSAYELVSKIVMAFKQGSGEMVFDDSVDAEGERRFPDFTNQDRKLSISIIQHPKTDTPILYDDGFRIPIDIRFIGVIH